MFSKEHRNVKKTAEKQKSAQIYPQAPEGSSS